ncbi:phosphoglucosamine mutase [Aestuariirhabdus litorea]|uniref:Phosphoglucosamine mutase n=1 Tax=Aestuariirhabdus litorea TaxID=2528527 RepID=A0A3P3VPH2_9GAMM|nr:phosphoglucosamine mutase [Aestuariirhabdus litorea]RRJ84500.1 phosphoglucosamine mutase [Aestuariirhabdus litorea]RWW97725.1 phosphoglucosamine mutase [Endozoicomonadaceae bacterium GTF-13]
MTRHYFGTDGVRGRVGEFPMTPDFAMRLGWAAGKVLAASGTKEVLIGKDTRASGYMLESALEAGFSAAGINIALAGPLPTPAVAYLTSTFRADAGVVISASHNPYYDNGIKFFSGEGTKLSDQQEHDIEALLALALEQGIECVESAALGKARRVDDASGRYIEFCKGTFPAQLNLRGLKIVVDSANGAAYKIAPAVYRELGADVISINDQPNGVNINAECGATHLDSLVAAVKEHGADLGIALDGDADRLMLVDDQGEVVDGDQILFILARSALDKGTLKGGVVGTQMSNLGLELALADHNIPFVRAKVGDRYVMEQLHQRGWCLGGENSGHILVLDEVTTGDAIVASLQVLAAALENNTSLAQLKAGMVKFPQQLINVRFGKDVQDPLTDNRVVQAVNDAEHSLDNRGRVLLRKSGTEPLIRVMVEADDERLCTRHAEHLAEVIRNITAA